MFNVIEKFVSIDGEGPSAGQLATFIRFSKCNLRCSWCDTKYSWDGSSDTTEMTAKEIYQYIKDSRVVNVTLTGGEPLIQPQIEELLDLLSQDEKLTTRIETNGSVSLATFKEKYKTSNIQFIVDYKLPASKMTPKMCLENLKIVNDWDVYKFVIASEIDLEAAIELVKEYDLTNRCLVYFSPVVEQVSPQIIVEAMKENHLNGVRLQLQLHKYIWPKEMRGV